jgi:hypothetical protein
VKLIKMCEKFGADLAAYVYGDLLPDEIRELEVHVDTCRACSSELRGLQRTALSLKPESLFTRESEVDWGAFASATVKRATGFQANRSRGNSSFLDWVDRMWRRPGLAAAAAGVLLMVGAALGTYGAFSLRQEQPLVIQTNGAVVGPTVPARLPASMLDDIEAFSAKAGTQKYLSESRAMLVSLLGSPIKCKKDSVDIRDERAKSLQLIRRQRLLANELNQLPLARAKQVCGDLERLLMEIVTLNDCAKAEQILELRKLVQEQQLLYRIDLLSDQMARSATDA